MSQLYDTFYTAGLHSTIKPTQQEPQVTHRAVKTSSTDYAQNATFTANRKVAVHTGLGADYGVIAHYHKGRVTYNRIYIRSIGYAWARYTAYSNTQYYICFGKLNGASYGSRQAVTHHTYYTVHSGDSWWAIANRNDVNMYTLASRNGKPINSTIYPGQTLLIK